MNLRNVLSAYSKLRQLSDDETALLETLRGLNDAERESLVVALQPEKVAGRQTVTRKLDHCIADGCSLTQRAVVHRDDNLKAYHEFQSGKGEKKSKRAASLSGAIQRAGKVRVEDDNDSDDDVRCVVVRSDNKPCGMLVDHNIHHMQSAMDYHPFVEPPSPAPGAARPSSANGEAGSTTANIETDSVAAGVAVGGSSTGED